MHSPFHELREATRVVQARIDAGPFTRAQADGTLSPPRRASFVRALHAVYGELEVAVAACALEPLRRTQPRLVARREQLESELGALGEDRRHVDAAVLRALVLAQSIRRAAAGSGTTLVGHLFAFEASELRCVFHGPSLPVADLEAALGSEAAITDAVAGALSALEGLEAIVDVVVSSQLDEQLAGALNSEAGSHPVPADVQEVRAALAAGERTWRAWTYYEARYGDRGLRFTRSDSAWLVTLAREDSSQARRQIAWLGRVLATRGMPRLLLEQHLEHLHAELCASLPDRAASYEPLRRAAEELTRERRAILSDADGEALAKQFDPRAPVESAVSPLEAGRLLVAAVVDERHGIAQAVVSLCRWLDDPLRFSAAWREAVTRTLQAARAACARAGG